MSPASFSRHPFPLSSSFFPLPPRSGQKFDGTACRVSFYRFTQLRIGELNGNKEEGEERDDSRRSLTEIHCFVRFIALISTPSRPNRIAIIRGDSFREYRRMKEKKKVEEEEERQKEKFERTSIERSVFDVARE